MSRRMVGLLAAVGTTMSALVGLTHGDMVPVMIASAGAVSGLAVYLGLPDEKNPSSLILLNLSHVRPCRDVPLSGGHEASSARCRLSVCFLQNFQVRLNRRA
jgi:hypothetical protein